MSKEDEIQNLLKNLEGCWYDIVGSYEVFMTPKDKYEYCKKIIELKNK